MAIVEIVPVGTPMEGDQAGQLIETVLIRGDLSPLTPHQRAEYYKRVCDSIGVNPLTKPFEYLHLNGKLILYALKACTDQLRSIYNVSVMQLEESHREGVFIVTAHVRNAAGRTDAAKGAVSIVGLKGEALANAFMRAETKAKRRATLSLCGLGVLDETEVEDIPAAKKAPPPTSISQRAIAARDVPIDEIPDHSAPTPERSSSPAPHSATEPAGISDGDRAGMTLAEEAREAARRGRDAFRAFCMRITRTQYNDAVKPILDQLHAVVNEVELSGGPWPTTLGEPRS